MTRPHETGERDDNPNGEESDDYRLTISEYDALADAYLEAISTQHDGGTTPLANRWVKFFNRVRHAFPFMVKSISDSQKLIEVLNATIEEHERKYGEIALDWDIEKRRAERRGEQIKELRDACIDAKGALQHPQNDWKGIRERVALDKINIALEASND